MGTDKLIKLLNEKIDLLKIEQELERSQLEEIQRLQTIIKAIQNNPFELYNLEDGTIEYIVSTLSLGQDYLEKLEKYKVIYDACLQFGREAIPQVAIVEKFIKETKEKLTAQKCSLADEVAKHQYTIVQCQNYDSLQHELSDPNKYVTRVDLLIKLLDESSLDTSEKNAIKLEIISRNNAIYQNALSANSNEEIKYKDDYDDRINEINEKLAEKFNPATLNNLNAISNLLSSCETKEEIEQIIDEWKFTFGDDSFLEVIDGLIDLKNVEMLLLRSLVGDEIDKYQSDLDDVNSQISLLEEYRESILETNELEENSTLVEIDEEEFSKVQRALNNYSEDPLATPNCVLFLTDAIDRDIRSIDDQETLEDIFLLIEQLRNNNVELKMRFTNNRNLRDLEKLKLNSKGKQARVIIVNLDDNIYGVIHVCGKKATSPKDLATTLESRRKNCNIDYLKHHIREPQVLDDYVEKTKNISKKLKDMVTVFYGEKETVVSGGVK